MNGKDLMQALTFIDSQFLAEAEAPQAISPPAPRLPRKAMLIAAILALSLLLVGCGVVYFLNLQDMKIGESVYTIPNHRDEDGNKIYATEVIRDVISLQGLADSPGARASREWLEFTNSYDPDNQILFASDENPIAVPRKYDAYFVYTQKMMDKAEEIAAKYDLKLAGQSAPFQREETAFFLESLSLARLHDPELAQVTYDGGYFYECGNFKTEFHLTIPQWEPRFPYPSVGSFSYHDKDYFYTLNASVTNMETCEQWSHTIPSGQQVLIVQDDSEYAKIFCDRPDAFLYLTFVDEYTDEEGILQRLTREEIQMAADAFDFAIQPRKPDMDQVNAYLDKAYAEAMARLEAEEATYVDPFSLKSYGEYVDYLIAQMGDPTSFYSHLTPDTLYYTILDFDGDGTEDFLYGGKDHFSAVMTIKNGTIQPLFGNGSVSYLCENHIIEQSYTGEEYDPNSYVYLQFADGTFTELHKMEYDSETATWFRVTYDDFGLLRQSITEAEARSVIDSYKRIDLDMKPLSTFPRE